MRQTNFIVETYLKDDSVIFIVRELVAPNQPPVLKGTFNSPDELRAFFNDFCAFGETSK